jgi:predicted phage terminase large subunit-like protein
MTLDAAYYVEAVDWCLRDDRDTPKDPGRLLTVEMALAVDAHDSLAAFVAQCFHVLDPATPLEWGWYLDLVCRELELVTSGQTRDLLICMPPGFGKSLIVNVLWPAWWWLREPHKRFVSLSSDDDLALRSNRRMREVLDSPWYQRLVERCAQIYGTPVWSFAKDQNRKEYYENTARGHRQSFSVGGSVTGQRGDGAIIDDPHQVRDVLGDPVAVKKTLDKTWGRVSQLATRVYDRRVSWRVTIAQRFHEIDAPGRILARNKNGKTRTVILAMRFDPDCPDNHPEDPRTEPGELLAPDRMPQKEVDELAAEIDETPGQASAQLDQRPIPPSGGLVKPHYLQPYDFDPQRPPTRWALVVCTIDATFKRTTKGSFVSISAWGILNEKRFLLGEIHARMDYVELREATRLAYAMWRANVTLVELKANGEALVRDLRDEIPGLIGVLPDPHGDKMTRAQLSMPAMAAKNVYIPSVEWMPTVNEWRAEMLAFPFGADDRMDGWSQMNLWLADNEALTRGNEEVYSALDAYLSELGAGV